MIEALIRETLKANAGIATALRGAAETPLDEFFHNISVPEKARLPAISMSFMSRGAAGIHGQGVLSIRHGILDINVWGGSGGADAYAVGNIGEMIEDLLNGRSFEGEGVQIYNITLDYAEKMLEYDTSRFRDLRTYSLQWSRINA